MISPINIQMSVSQTLFRLCFLSASRRSKTTLTYRSFFSLLTDSDHSPKSSVPNALFFNYLIDSFGFPKSRALSVWNSYKEIKTQKRLGSVVDFFETMRFSDAQIRSLVGGSPKLLFADNKTLEPKLEFFQELGLSGSDLEVTIEDLHVCLTGCSIAVVISNVERSLIKVHAHGEGR